MKKRFMGITLSLCMMLVAAPASAFAACNDSGAARGDIKDYSFGQLKANYICNQDSKCGSGSDNAWSTNPWNNQGSNICGNKNNSVCSNTINNLCNNILNEKCGNTCGNTCGNGNNNCQGNPGEGAPGSKPDLPGTPGNKPSIPDSKPDMPNIGSYERQVADIVNQERAAAGLPALTVNSKLSGVAEKKAADMRDNNYFSHTSPTYGSPFDMMKQFGITYTAAGENIAEGQKSPASVMNAWMNSSGHKANILSTSFKEIGVGYVTDSKGNTYWVQMFIK